MIYITQNPNQLYILYQLYKWAVTPFTFSNLWAYIMYKAVSPYYKVNTAPRASV